LYCSNGNLISCSSDGNIKIWKKNNNNNYENIKILTHSDYVYSILFFEDKNILISSGKDGTKFWNLNKNEINYNNINCIKDFKEVYCYSNNGLCKLDEDRIIIGGDKSLKIISILNKIIIKEINIPFKCLGIILIEDKGIFLNFFIYYFIHILNSFIIILMIYFFNIFIVFIGLINFFIPFFLFI